MTTNSFDQVIELIKAERAYQDAKWGTVEEHPSPIPGYLLIIEAELTEAKLGWLKNSTGRHAVLSEIIQIAATAIACLEQHVVD